MPDAFVYDHVRTPRGRDIMAACGQLRSESVKERASLRRTEAGAMETARA